MNNVNLFLKGMAARKGILQSDLSWRTEPWTESKGITQNGLSNWIIVPTGYQHITPQSLHVLDVTSVMSLSLDNNTCNE